MSTSGRTPLVLSPDCIDCAKALNSSNGCRPPFVASRSATVFCHIASPPGSPSTPRLPAGLSALYSRARFKRSITFVSSGSMERDLRAQHISRDAGIFNSEADSRHDTTLWPPRTFLRGDGSCQDTRNLVHDAGSVRSPSYTLSVHHPTDWEKKVIRSTSDNANLPREKLTQAFCTLDQGSSTSSPRSRPSLARSPSIQSLAPNAVMLLGTYETQRKGYSVSVRLLLNEGRL